MKPKYFPITDINPQVGDFVRSIHWMHECYALVDKIRYLKGKPVGAWLKMFEGSRRLIDWIHQDPMYFGQTIGLEDWRKFKGFYEFKIYMAGPLPPLNLRPTYKEIFYDYDRQ